MSQNIPTSEPESLVAGDTVTWQKTLSDYPASDGWVLSYRLINAAGNIDITSSASGDDHLVSVAATATAGWSYVGTTARCRPAPMATAFMADEMPCTSR